MSSFVLTRRAEEDLDAIDDDVAERFGDAVAERVTQRLFEVFDLLADQPAIGSARPHWTDEDVLFWPVAGTPTMVIYRNTKPLQILRIWNGRQDPRSVADELNDSTS